VLNVVNVIIGNVIRTNYSITDNNKRSMSRDKQLYDILRSLQKGEIGTDGAHIQILRLFSVSNSVKIALLEQLEELSEHIPCEVYTKKVIEIKSNFNDC
jgi:hypothetical protein